ncbi:MAG: protein phosphatase 2C domain-containing protein [Clostridiales bacterium]|nr:protein phosphatase 2C domain-containing protein [Clostridiales bacterium]
MLKFAVSGNTDVGIKKETNQDSLLLRKYSTCFGEVVFAVLCDGMGGLAKGEVASASLINAFRNWADENIMTSFTKDGGINYEEVQMKWMTLITSMNAKIKAYGRQNGVSLGTTVTAILISQKDYYIVNVGDTRAYIISDALYVLTEDQTLVEKEVREGKLTPEQAEKDPRRSVLLQCVGASENVYPDFFYGETMPDTVFMLCSDGFRHEVTAEEIFGAFNPSVLCDEQTMYSNATCLIEANKTRQERDNITVALIRSYQEG